MADLVEQIRITASQVGEDRFLELLRWHRVISRLPDIDPRAHGAYRTAIAELGEARATELLHDLRKLARNPRRYRNGLDGKPRYRDGKTLRTSRERQQPKAG